MNYRAESYSLFPEHPLLRSSGYRRSAGVDVEFLVDAGEGVSLTCNYARLSIL
jgi:hypothetical protein